MLYSVTEVSQDKVPGERARISQSLRERDTERARALADDVDEAPSKARRVPFLGGLKNKQTG